MTVYIDTLFFINAIFDYFLLALTAALLTSKAKWYQLLLGSMFGGVCGVGIFMMDLPSVWGFLCLLFSAAAMITIAFPRAPTWRMWLRALLGFYAVSFLLGSILFALLFTTKFGMCMGAAFHSGIFYARLSTRTLFLLLLCGIFLLKFVARFAKRRLTVAACYVTISYRLYQTDLTQVALVDTGSFLSDPLYHLPVIVVSLSAIKEALPENSLSFFTNEGAPTHTADFPLHTVPFHSLGCQSGFLWSTAPTTITMVDTKKKISTTRAVIAISPHAVSANERYTAILPSTCMKR